jgi:hypothetical protein
VLESTARSAPPGTSAPLPEGASLAEAGLTGVARRRLYMPLPASGSRRAAISGCEGREGAGQTVKEPGRRYAYAGPLTSHFSCAFTIPYRTQFPLGMPDTDLAQRPSRHRGDLSSAGRSLRCLTVHEACFVEAEVVNHHSPSALAVGPTSRRGVSPLAVGGGWSQVRGLAAPSSLLGPGRLRT